MIKFKLNETGQTFVVMVMLMISALIIGTTISARFVKSLRTIVNADNGSKAQAVAEAGVERILLTPYATLQNYISNNNCGSNCTVQITDSTGQKLTATITLKFIGNTTGNYPVTIDEDAVSNVILNGYPSGSNVNICWNGTSSVYGLYLYSQSSTTKATPFAYNAVLAQNTTNGFTSSAAGYGYENCFSITASQTPLALRLYSAYGRSDAVIIPNSGFSIPIQGIQIESIGVAGEAKKKVVVLKTTPAAPAYFDFALYQKDWNQTLSN